jgi:hypothetical protein
MRPGERVRLASEHQGHQLVVGGVKFHQIDAVTEAVVRTQLRQMSVRLARELLDLLASNQCPGVFQVGRRPIGTESPDGLDQRPVVGIGVVVLQSAGWFSTSWVAKPNA